MSDTATSAPWDGAPFELTVAWSQPVDAAIEAAGVDFVHFFFKDGIAADALPEEAGEATATYRLVALDHSSELRSAHFELPEGCAHAGLRELLAFAQAFPEAHAQADVLALGLMRWRKVYDDRAGETIWGAFELERTMCQWVTGLGGHAGSKRLMPFEVFLGDLLRRGAWALVRQGA